MKPAPLIAFAFLLLALSQPIAAQPTRVTVAGSLVVNVKSFGARGDGATDDTAAIQAAIDATARGVIFFPKGIYRVSQTLRITTKNSLMLLGEGSFYGSTLDATHNGHVLEFQTCSHSGAASLHLKHAGQPSSGFGIVFNRAPGQSVGSFACLVDDVRMDDLHGGILVEGSTICVLRHVQLRNLDGPTGFLFQGTGPGASGSYRCTVSDLIADNPNNGNASIDWIVQDSWGYSLVLDQVAVLNGGRGIVLRDSANTGSSYPLWMLGWDLECDHNRVDAVALEGGEGFFATTSWLGSSLEGHGLHIGPGFRGEVTLENSRLYGNARHGISMNAGPIDVLIRGNVIGDNGTQSPGSYHGIRVAGGAERFLITGNTIGDGVGVTGNAQSFGIHLAAGSTRDFVIQGNVLVGNLNGALRDLSTGTGGEIHGNAGHRSGLLPPKLTPGEIAGIPSPPAGSIVFNTTTSKLQVFDGSSWIDLH